MATKQVDEDEVVASVPQAVFRTGRQGQPVVVQEVPGEGAQRKASLRIDELEEEGFREGHCFRAALAGCALTITSFPNISFVPAFVAAFLWVLIMTSLGMTNLPAAAGRVI